MAEQWKTILVRVTPAQHDKLAELAKAGDRSMASTIRRLIERATK